MSNTSREGSRQRSQTLSVSSYSVVVELSGRDLDGATLDAPERTFVSSSTARFSSIGGASEIDIIADAVLSATLDGEALDVGAFTGSTFPFETGEGDHELTIVALCRYSNSGEGLHRFVDPADGLVYLYSQFESADARRAYACFDQPDQKATFQFSVIAPKDWVVLSNSPRVEPSKAGKGIRRWDFAPTLRMSTYITAIIAGSYHLIEAQIETASGTIPASVSCRRSVAEFADADKILETTQKGFEIYERHFDYPYPFGSYDQVFVPEFNFGAMENAGCITFRDQYLFRSRVTQREYEARDNTILHELAHMWFGDLVTMRWWDDLWLNESFAEWASHFCQAEWAKEDPTRVDPWVGFANERKTWAYMQDQLPTTHPIAADMVDLDAVEQNFDGITYAKGASVLKLLVSFVGQDAFLAGVRAYFRKHAFQNTQLRDLLTELEVASGRDLSWFTGEWLDTSGPNTFRADFDLDEHGQFTRFDLVQSAHPDWPTLRTHRLGIGIYSIIDGELRQIERLDVDAFEERTPIAALVGHSRGDMILLNDGDLTYAKTRFDDHSLQTAIEHLATLKDPLARAMVWATAWDMTRDAEMSSADYVRLVLAAVESETDQTAISAVLRQAFVAATQFTAPELRDQLRDKLVSGSARLLKSAGAGSDEQLSFARSLIRSLHHGTGTELVTGWLNDEEVPRGLPIDTENRWLILSALARMGMITEEDLAAERALDNTNVGVERYAGALSAMSDAAAKAESWRLASSDVSVPNETMRQICMNFFQYDQDDLLVPYRDQFIGLLDDMSQKKGAWALRGTAAREAVLRFMFPMPVVNESFLASLAAWLEGVSHNEPVVRGVREQLADGYRALACQHRSLQELR